MTITTERELQRVSHLVLGKPRPAPTLPRKPSGMSKQEWKVEKQRLRDAGLQLVEGGSHGQMGSAQPGRRTERR